MQKSTLSVSYLGQLAAKENRVPYVDQNSVEGRVPGTSAGLIGGFCGDIGGGDTSGAAYSRETKYNQEESNKYQPLYLGILRVGKLNTYLALEDWETLHDQNFL